MPYHTVADIETPELHYIASETTIQDALTTMFSEDTLQLGLQEGETFVGVVTFRTIGRALLIHGRLDVDQNFTNRSIDIASESNPPVISPDTNVFDLFDILADSPYVIISPEDGPRQVLRDVGFHRYLRTELEEVLLIEETERLLRQLLRQETDDISAVLQDTFEDLESLPTPSDLEHCSWGHYPVLVSAQWEIFEDAFEHDQAFVRELLEEVGEIRNRLFHFRGDENVNHIERDIIDFAHQYIDSATETTQTN